jgi:hypothetical protein
MKTASWICAGLAALASPAYADAPYRASGIGVGVTAGGGVTGFTDSGMRDVTNTVGGLWDLRVAIGTHTNIGIELGYTGTAASVETFTGADNGTLIGTTFEGVARWNLMPTSAFTPIIFAGVGWQHYSLTDSNFPTSDTGMSDHDDILDVPAGLGLSYRALSGLLFDLRGTFRVATFNDLLVKPNGDDAQLHTWEASAAIGYEM